MDINYSQYAVFEIGSKECPQENPDEIFNTIEEAQISNVLLWFRSFYPDVCFISKNKAKKALHLLILSYASIDLKK